MIILEKLFNIFANIWYCYIARWLLILVTAIQIKIIWANETELVDLIMMFFLTCLSPSKYAAHCIAKVLWFFLQYSALQDDAGQCSTMQCHVQCKVLTSFLITVFFNKIIQFIVMEGHRSLDNLQLFDA